jgi:uncharacterized membrane protein YedE/YeeE
VSETLLLNDIVPIHWAIGGVILGVLVLLLLWVTNVRLGMSTGFESVCATVSKLPYFRRPSLTRTNAMRLSMVAGLVAGGLLSALLSGGWAPMWDLGRFDTLISESQSAKVAWMAIGGACIGFGTRLAGGCTSGHAIFGFPLGDKASIRSTLAFMGAGVVTANVVYRLIFT